MNEANKKLNKINWLEFQNELVTKASKDETFREELIKNPKAVLESEFSKAAGEAVKLPENMEVKVLDQSMDMVYIPLLPKWPSETPAADSELSDEQLNQVAGGCFDGEGSICPITLYSADCITY